MPAPVTLTLVFQGLIAFVPSGQDLSAYLIDTKKPIPGHDCAMPHFPKIRFETKICTAPGCKLIPQDATCGPKKNTCECDLTHDLISIGPTAGDVNPKIVAHNPPHPIPGSNESSDPTYVVNMDNLGAKLDPAKLDLTKNISAKITFAYGDLKAANYAHQKGYAKRFVFKQIGTWGLTSHVQTIATTFVATTSVLEGEPVFLKLIDVLDHKVRTFTLAGRELLIQNEPEPDERYGPCDLDPCSETGIGHDFIRYYELVQGGLASAEINLPHAQSEALKACEPPFPTPYASDLESPPHYAAACKCPQPKKAGATVISATRDQSRCPKAVTSRPICPMAVFIQ